jgi:hypothetical protein
LETTRFVLSVLALCQRPCRGLDIKKKNPRFHEGDMEPTSGFEPLTC